jgi:hypothetical protein
LILLNSPRIKSTESDPLSEGLKTGERVLDLRAVSRSGGMFVGLLVAPMVANASGLWWGWCVLSAIAAAAAGFIVAGAIGRRVFLAAPGHTVVTRVGPSALGVALRASIAGGSVVAMACAVVAYFGAGTVWSGIAFLAGIAVCVGAGFLSALL